MHSELSLYLAFLVLLPQIIISKQDSIKKKKKKHNTQHNSIFQGRPTAGGRIFSKEKIQNNQSWQTSHWLKKV